MKIELFDINNTETNKKKNQQIGLIKNKFV